MLTTNTTIARYTTSVVIRITSANQTTSVITICRQASLKEECGGGRDADCDGLPDEEDPDCNPKVAANARPCTNCNLSYVKGWAGQQAQVRNHV